MLCDFLDLWKTYVKDFSPLFQVAFPWIQKAIKSPLTEERYNLQDGVYSLVQNYETKSLEGAKFENHRKFIDVHLVIQGVEWIYWTKGKKVFQLESYSDKNDAEFFMAHPSANIFSHLVIEPGIVAIFWPGDWHLPCITPQTDKKPQKVTKIVVKIPVSK